MAKKSKFRIGTVAAVVALLIGGLAVAGGPWAIARADGPQSGAPWPQLKQNGTGTGIGSVNGPFTPAVFCTYIAGGNIVAGPVIESDGTVVVVTNQGSVRAVKPDCTERWKYSFTGQAGYPAVNSKNRVVIGTDQGFIIGINGSDGSEAWKFALSTAPYSNGGTVAVKAPIMAPSNYANLLSGNDQGNVYELNDGVYAGVRRANDSIRGGTIVTPDGTLVWTSYEKAVYGGFTSGGDKWKVSVDNNVNDTPAAGADSTIYVATDSGTVYALRSIDGSQKWRTSVSIQPIKGSPVIGLDGSVYVGSNDSKLYALDPATGNVKWSFITGGAITSAPAVGANGLIYLASTDSTLYVLGTDGKLMNSWKADGSIDVSSPAIAADGKVWIGSTNGTLYALKEGAATPTPTAAVTATPTAPPSTPTATPTPNPTDRVAAVAGATYFQETGHNVSGPFLDFFSSHGGLEQFGFPRTEQIPENGLTVQYFQRARFELHPENTGTPFLVQLTLLGDQITAPRRPFPTATPVDNSDSLHFFPEVNHTVQGVFWSYFNAHGGLDRFGFPISEQLQEQNNDGTGRTYTVQYYQRARLEFHPELSGTPFEIQLGLLGDQVLIANGLLKG